MTLLLAATVHLVQHPHPDETYDLASPETSTLKHFLKPAVGGWLAVLRACPIVFFAFSCQVNVCQIYDELPNMGGGSEFKVRTMKWVTWLAVGLCGTLYTSISLVSLMDFGENVMPNMLSCYTLTSRETLLHIAFLAMALAIVMAFPLNIFPARVSIIQMIAKHPCTSIAVDDQECQQLLQPSPDGECLTRYSELEEANHESVQPLRSQLLAQESSIGNENAESLYSEDEEDFQAGQHVLVTLLLAGLALGLALVIPDISVIFGLLGGTTSALLGFVIPGLMGLKMDQGDLTSWVLVVAGALIGILTTGVTIYSTFQSL
jgi:amino acid permease